MPLPEVVDAAPFVAWVDRRCVVAGSSAAAAEQLGVGEDWLRKGSFRRRGTISTEQLIAVLDAAGLPLTDVYDADEYPELYEVELEPDAFCGRCHETVTPIEGRCPWCDGAVEDAVGHDKRYCGRCDKLVSPANNGTCWRCGEQTVATVPWSPCACGCGQMKRTFDPQGRRVRYLRGHGPQTNGTGNVPVEPFARYLEQQLRDLDVIAAIARLHGMSRDAVVAVLSRRDAEVDRSTVQRAVWAAARGGTGKGLPPRPGAPTYFDLYPDDARSKVCPGCGGGKARAAELCKVCRRRQTNGRTGGDRPRSIREEVVEMAYRAYWDENITQLAAAERVLEHVPHTSAVSLVQILRVEWASRGWELRTRTTSSAAAGAAASTGNAGGKG